MEKSLKEKTVNEIITLFLTERGLDPADEKARGEYPVEVVRRFQAGDTQALVELLRIGTHHGAVTHFKI
jgi:hypothetical protein